MSKTHQEVSLKQRFSSTIYHKEPYRICYGYHFFPHIHTDLPTAISNFRFLKRKRCSRKMILKRFISWYYESPLGIFCVPLRPLHLPFAQITLEKQMLKNITRIRKQKIINHTKKNTSTVLRFRKYSTL